MKKIITVLLIVAVGIFVYFPVHGESEIYDTVVRLHVLANSDSDEDQALKLEVRDAILEITGPLVRGCSERKDAVAAINAAVPEIQAVAEKVISDAGYDYPVKIELGIENYPERKYESCCFPSGDYISLRIGIGDAEGHNWWCVLFPPMCLSAASADNALKNEDAFIQTGLTGEQYKIITESESNTKYKVRFKILEVFEDIFG